MPRTAHSATAQNDDVRRHLTGSTPGQGSTSQLNNSTLLTGACSQVRTRHRTREGSNRTTASLRFHNSLHPSFPCTAPSASSFQHPYLLDIHILSHILECPLFPSVVVDQAQKIVPIFNHVHVLCHYSATYFLRLSAITSVFLRSKLHSWWCPCVNSLSSSLTTKYSTQNPQTLFSKKVLKQSQS